MSQIKNRAVVLKQRPNGKPKDEDFEIVEREVPELQDDQVLLRTLWLSLDPYMRPMMNDLKSYAEPVPLGGVVIGEIVGEVVASRSPNFEPGDKVTAYGGWQEYVLANETLSRMYKINEVGVPLSAYLGATGMTGRTAYGGLMHLGKPKPGETLVVSAASGAVGSIVGQLAKQQGCRTVGIAGGAEKCRYVVEELGFDHCIDYKSEDLSQALSKACPDGIDIYFENVGGGVAKAVAPLLNAGSRVPICGFVANYNDQDITKAETPQEIFGALDNPPEHRFFLQTEWQDQHQEVTDTLSAMVKAGDLVYRESIAEGLENAVVAFQGMLQGKNFGKQLVRIADPS